jgi:predicted RNase H-like HicB family nuclease
VSTINQPRVKAPLKLHTTVTLACFVSLERESGIFVSHCPALSVYSQGETESEALRALRSAIKLHVTAMNRFYAGKRGSIRWQRFLRIIALAKGQ